MSRAAAPHPNQDDGGAVRRSRREVLCIVEEDLDHGGPTALLRSAYAVAAAMDARLVVVAVATPTLATAALMPVAVPAGSRPGHADAEQRARRLAAAAGVVPDAVVGLDRPAVRTLIACSHDERTALLVAADDGCTPLRAVWRRGLGRVLARRVRRPELLVPPRTPPCHLEDAEGPVICVLPGDSRARRQARVAAQLALKLDRGLLLVRSCVGERSDAGYRAARQIGLEARIAAADAGLEAGLHVVERSAGAAAITLAQEHDAALITVPPAQNGPLWAWLAGAPVPHLLEHATVPVLVVPDTPELRL